MNKSLLERGSQASSSDQDQEYYNRVSPPVLYECGVRGHTDHDAEGFVVFGTAEGQECIPTCMAGAVLIMDELAGSHGIRYVNREVASAAKGKILGKLSNR